MVRLGANVTGVMSAINALRSVKNAYGQRAVWIVGVGAEYGAYLEFGTSKMPPYPFLFPAARHVMNTKFDQIEQEAHGKSDPTEFIVSSLALEIERQAKINADAANKRFGGTRSPGTHPDHPQIQTSNLVGSIEAYPAAALGGP